MITALRSYWELPAVAHFCSLFRSVFKLVDFDIEVLILIGVMLANYLIFIFNFMKKDKFRTSKMLLSPTQNVVRQVVVVHLLLTCF